MDVMSLISPVFPDDYMCLTIQYFKGAINVQFIEFNYAFKIDFSTTKWYS